MAAKLQGINYIQFILDKELVDNIYNLQCVRAIRSRQFPCEGVDIHPHI
jgi:hypothetical protein